MTFARLLVLILASTLQFLSVASADEQAPEKKLYEAVLFQDLPAVKDLIAKGAKATYRENDRPLLGWAAQGGNVEIVQALLDGGANPNDGDGNGGHSPLMRAIDTQFPGVVRVLLKAKADPNFTTAQGKTVLTMAVESRKPEIVQAVIDAGANVKWVSPEGDSPALSAAQDGMPESIEIIRMLGKAGAEMNASNAAYTPLSYALEQERGDLVQALLDAGADPNKPTQMGKLPIAIGVSKPELLEKLLRAKADPNKEIEYVGSALMQAIQESNSASVKLLLEAGAKAETGDSAGITALQAAEQASQTEIVELLKKHGAGGKAQVNAGIPIVAFESGGTTCTIVDAAKRHMELHALLQAQVDAGKMNSDIFRTFGDDTKDYGQMLTENPADACKLFERLRVKYGV